MKKKVITVIVFFSLLILFGIVLMIIQISNFGGLTGLIILDEAAGYGKHIMAFIGLIVILTVIIEIVVLVMWNIRRKKGKYVLVHDLR